MKVETRIKIIEEDGFKNSSLELKVRNHQEQGDLVILEYDGREFTVPADELRRAVDNTQSY